MKYIYNDDISDIRVCVVGIFVKEPPKKSFLNDRRRGGQGVS